MKNKSHSPVTEMLSGKYKICLIVGLAIMLTVDIAACIALWVHGVGFGYWFIPFATAMYDLLYLVGVALSNQRFKYARSLFIVYIVLTIVMCIVWVLSATLTDGLVFDNATIVLWSVFHVVGIAAAIVTYLYAARRIRSGNKLQLVAIIAACVLVLACGFFYSVSLINDGYFGQGTANRPLTFEYLDNDECAVTGLVDGNETTVVVPYEFNGKLVTKVSANVLTSGIKSVTLNCDARAAIFTDISEVNGVNSDVVLNVNRSNIDAFKTALYDSAQTRELGNNLRPADLAEDEVFITFSYDRQSFELADKIVIPTWYGKKGDVFKLSDVNDVPYAKASDVNSDADLYYGYNTNKYIMSAPVSDGKQINGVAITDSCVNVPVRFQRVYRVYPGTSNDTKYDTSRFFPFSEVNGTKLDYKLTVADNADKMLEGFTRTGFTRTMYCQYGDNGSFSSAMPMPGTLGEVLGAYQTGDVKIAPHWELVAPTVNVTPAQGGTNSVVYGDRFILSATITHPILDELDLEYEWYENGEKVGCIGDALVVDKTNYAGAGQYKVVVTGSAPAITSCKSTQTATTDMNISPRPLTVNWTDDIPNNVYNDSDFDLSIALINTLDGDDVELKQSSFTMHDAKTYAFTAELDGDDKDCYYIVDADKSRSYTIKPCPINVTWDALRSFEYNGGEQIPRIEAYDLHGEPLVMTKIGAQIDAGENYTASAVVRENTNYVVADTPENKVTFTIYPKEVDAAWGNTEFEYISLVRVPSAHFYDVDDAEVELTVEGGRINANIINGTKTETYIAVASSPDKNYTVSPESAEREFTIDQREVRIIWSAAELTYNGEAQAPSAAYYKVNNLRYSADVSGAEINAITQVGQKYIATAGIDDVNYKIEPGYESIEFTIMPYVVNIKWNSLSLTYSGSAQVPSATATGINGTNLPLDISGAQTLAGENYTAYANFVTADSNYNLQNTQASYTINKKGITVEWTGLQFEYDGNPHIPTHTVKGAIGNIDYSVSGERIAAGNNYTATFTLDDDNHVVTSGGTCSFRINPQSVAVSWSNQTTFTYNGQNNYHAPTATATDKQGRSVPVTVSGARAAAGNGTAIASTPDTNYTLTGAAKGFTIERCSLTVTWSNATFTYDGTEKIPTAEVTGIDGENLGLALLGGATNAGKGYIVIATITNANYVLENDTETFDIDPATAKVNWGSTYLTYNGYRQAPEASITGVDGKTIALTVDGGMINAGYKYKATALAPNGNYTLTSSESEFNILAASVKVDWGSTLLTYNGKTQAPSASFKDVYGRTAPVAVEGARKDVGSGTAVASTTDANYTLTDNEKPFTVEKKAVTVSITSITVEYGETPEYVFQVSGLITGDNVTVTCSVVYTADSDGNIPVGTYNIVATLGGTASGNYSLTVVKTGMLTVKPAPEPEPEAE